MGRRTAIIYLLAILLVVFKSLQATVTHDDSHHKAIKEKMDSYFFNKIVTSVLHHTPHITHQKEHPNPVFHYGNREYGHHHGPTHTAQCKHILVPHGSNIRTDPRIRIILHRVDNVRNLFKQHNALSSSHNDDQIPPIQHHTTIHTTITSRPLTHIQLEAELFKGKWVETPNVEAKKEQGQNTAAQIAVDKQNATVPVTIDNVFQNVLKVISYPSADITRKEVIDVPSEQTKLSRELAVVTEANLNVVTAIDEESLSTKKNVQLFATEKDLVKSYSEADFTVNPPQNVTTSENSNEKEVKTTQPDLLTLLAPPLDDTKKDKISFLSVEDQQTDGEIAETDIFLLARELGDDKTGVTSIRTTTEVFSEKEAPATTTFHVKSSVGQGLAYARGGGEAKLESMMVTAADAFVGKEVREDATRDETEEREVVLDGRKTQSNEKEAETIIARTMTTEPFVGNEVTVYTTSEDVTIGTESEEFMNARELDNYKNAGESMITTIIDTTDSSAGIETEALSERALKEMQIFEGTASDQPLGWETLKIENEERTLVTTDKAFVTESLRVDGKEIIEGRLFSGPTALRRPEKPSAYSVRQTVETKTLSKNTEFDDLNNWNMPGETTSPEGQIMSSFYSAIEDAETTATPALEVLDDGSELEGSLRKLNITWQEMASSNRKLLASANSAVHITEKDIAGEERIIFNPELETIYEGTTNLGLTEDFQQPGMTGTSDERENFSEDATMSTMTPSQVTQNQNLISSPISSGSIESIDPNHRRSDVMVADEYGDQTVETANLTPEDLLQMIPIVVRELRKDAISPEEQAVLANVYGDFWPNIIQLVHSRDLEIETLIQDPSVLKKMLDPVMLQDEVPRPLRRKSRAPRRDFMGDLYDSSEESKSSSLIESSEESGPEHYSHEEDTEDHYEVDAPKFRTFIQDQQSHETHSHSEQDSCEHR